MVTHSAQALCAPPLRQRYKTALMAFPWPDKNLALSHLETRILLVNDVYAALASHHTAIFIPDFRRFQRISDFHNPSSAISSPDYIRAAKIHLYADASGS